LFKISEILKSSPGLEVMLKGEQKESAISMKLKSVTNRSLHNYNFYFSGYFAFGV